MTRNSFSKRARIAESIKRNIIEDGFINKNRNVYS